MSQLNLEKFEKLNLGDYDFIIAVDKSGSMASRDCPGNLSRYQLAHKWSKEVAEICSHFDKDGIDLVLFDSDIDVFNGVSPAKVDEIFRKNSPGGGTETGEAIRKALPEYFKGDGLSSLFGGSKKVTRSKPVVLLILTDGEPNDATDVSSAIIKITKKISSRKDVGISFLQVGTDNHARRFLKELDDELVNKGAKFDIVDTVTYEDSMNMSVEDIIVGALTD